MPACQIHFDKGFPPQDIPKKLNEKIYSRKQKAC